MLAPQILCFLQAIQDPSLGGVQSATSETLALGLTSGALFFLLPRRLILLPIVLVACFIPLTSAISILGMHFSMLRLAVIFGWARVLFSRLYFHFRWARLDSIFCLWVLMRLVTFSLLWQTSQAFVNGLGYAYDAIGLYLLFRVLIRDMEGVTRAIRTFAILLFPVAVFLWAEKVTGKNPFHLLGAVPEFALVRDGVIRAQGPFGHPILAGTFGAVWLPLFIGLGLQDKRHRFIAAVGIVASTLITLASGSSGPIGSYLAGILGLSLWKARQHMRAIRWGILGCLFTLHIVMHDPVWFIFAHMDVLSGSTGWHRANLIDRAIANYSDWWALGTKDVARWGVFAGDTTNMFVSEGVRGGVIVFLLFVYIIVAAYSSLGLRMKAERGRSKGVELLLWTIGASIFSHIVSFFGVSYFDQNVVNWYLVLAIVVAMARCRSTAAPPGGTARGAVESRSPAARALRSQIVLERTNLITAAWLLIR